MDVSEIKKRFTYHSPKPGQTEKYSAIREKSKELAELINEVVPDEGDEKIRAIHKIEEAVMLANAGIARREIPTESKK